MSFRSRSDGSHYPVGSQGKTVYVDSDQSEQVRSEIDWFNNEWRQAVDDRDWRKKGELLEAAQKAKENTGDSEYSTWIKDHKFNTEDTREGLLERAKEDIGTTSSFEEAGYILEDGSMLDFSGKNNGGQPFTRSMDHREISRIFMSSGSGDQHMQEFQEKTGALRFVITNGDINVQFDTFHKPNDKQWAKLTQAVNYSNRVNSGQVNLYYDVFDRRGNLLDRGDYENATHRSIASLKHVLDTDINKEGSR